MKNTIKYADGLKDIAKDLHYRDSLFDTLKNMNKSDRHLLLSNEKSNFQYASTRAEKLKNTNDIIFNDSEIIVNKARLYHGTGKKGINNFRVAHDSTIGEGIYLTSNFYDAYGYARKRPADNRSVYECVVSDLKLLNLQTEEKIALYLTNSLEYLQKYLRDNQKAPHYVTNNLAHCIGYIQTNFYNPEKTPHYIFSRLSKIITQKMIDDGYDGAYAYERELGDYFAHGYHNSFVIFDPEMVKIVDEYSALTDALESPN